MQGMRTKTHSSFAASLVWQGERSHAPSIGVASEPAPTEPTYPYHAGDTHGRIVAEGTNRHASLYIRCQGVMHRITQDLRSLPLLNKVHYSTTCVAGCAQVGLTDGVLVQLPGVMFVATCIQYFTRGSMML